MSTEYNRKNKQDFINHREIRDRNVELSRQHEDSMIKKIRKKAGNYVKKEQQTFNRHCRSTIQQKKSFKKKKKEKGEAKN